MTSNDNGYHDVPFVDTSGTVGKISEAEYYRKRRHNYAGEVSELLFSDTRNKYYAMGATHWHMSNENGAVVLGPVYVEGVTDFNEMGKLDRATRRPSLEADGVLKRRGVSYKDQVAYAKGYSEGA